MTPEGKVKKKVIALLKQYGAYYHMPVQQGFGTPALDFHVCHRGYYCGIETKAEGKKPTPRQESIIEEIHAAGGFVFVIIGVEGLGHSELEAWLMKNELLAHNKTREGHERNLERQRTRFAEDGQP